MYFPKISRQPLSPIVSIVYEIKLSATLMNLLCKTLPRRNVLYYILIQGFYWLWQTLHMFAMKIVLSYHDEKWTPLLWSKLQPVQSFLSRSGLSARLFEIFLFINLIIVFSLYPIRVQIKTRSICQLTGTLIPFRCPGNNTSSRRVRSKKIFFHRWKALRHFIFHLMCSRGEPILSFMRFFVSCGSLWNFFLSMLSELGKIRL